MRRFLRSRRAWFGTLAILAALAIGVRDVGIAGAGGRRGAVITAAVVAVAGTAALALSHFRRTRRARSRARTL